MARFLIEHGASVDHPNKVLFCSFWFSIIDFAYYHIPQSGYSPLQAACNFGNTDIVKLLILFKANIEFKNNVGFVLAIIIHTSFMILIIITYRKAEQD